MTFDDFAADAAELFGMTENESADLLLRLEDEYDFDFREDALRDYGVEASEYFEDVVEAEDEPLYVDWLDIGEEWELTAEGYGED